MVVSEEDFTINNLWKSFDIVLDSVETFYKCI